MSKDWRPARSGERPYGRNLLDFRTTLVRLAHFRGVKRAGYSSPTPYTIPSAETEIAFAAAFGSIRRFNETIPVTSWAAAGACEGFGGADNTGGVTALVYSVFMRWRYPPPYDWPAILEFLSAERGRFPGGSMLNADSYPLPVSIRRVQGNL